MFGIVQDITEEKLLEEKLRKSYNIIAQAEALANMGSWEVDIRNRRLTLSDEAKKIFQFNSENFNNKNVHFLKRLRLQCEHSKKFKKPFALMLLDISEIRNVNYTLGYEAGEQLVIGIVERLKAYLGEETFISRYYDDLFAILIQGMRDLGDYETIGKGIIKQFKQPFKIRSYEIDINVNLGICIYPKDAEDLHSLRLNAKLALIRAKKEGKNVYKFYASDLDIKSYREFILKSDLHKVIKENQLYLNYQPIVRLKDNSILAVEALLRWNHPEWGEIVPNDFIYLAEKTGIIVDIGKWTLREICKHYKGWIEKGLGSIKEE